MYTRIYILCVLNVESLIYTKTVRVRNEYVDELTGFPCNFRIVFPQYAQGNY